MIKIQDWLYDEFIQVGKNYNSNAEVAVYEETHSQFRDLIKESNELLDTLKAKKGESLIDFGCGTGVLAIQAALREINVYAVDISKNMLNYANQKAKEKNINTISFVNSGFLNYHHSSGLVNYIISSFSFHHLPDFWKGIALKRMHNMLNDTGILYIQDIVIQEDNCINNINSFINSQEEQGGDFLKNDALEHFRDEYSTYDWILEAMLERAGFKIELKKISLGLICRYKCVKTA